MNFYLRKTRPETPSSAFKENSEQLSSEKRMLSCKTLNYKFYETFKRKKFSSGKKQEKEKYTKSRIVELRIAGMKHSGKALLRKLKREHGKKELCKMQEKVEISLESFETG